VFDEWLGDQRSVHHLRQSTIRTKAISVRRVSGVGVYSAEAVEAWASGRTVEDVRRMIETAYGLVANVEQAVVGWANLDGGEVDAGGQRVARCLYETIEQLARDDGIVQLSAVASLRAEPAFRRFGFREVASYEQIFNGHVFTVVE